jgi:CHAT domain-containing protein/tetratricopeptide (TPR) repeat protein
LSRLIVATAALWLVVTPIAVDRLVSQAGPRDQVTAEGIRQALDAGRYAEAERLALADGADSDLLVEALTKSGKGGVASTLALAERVVAEKRKRFGMEAPETAISLHNLGALLAVRGEFAKAIAAHEEALSIRRRLLPRNDPQLADSLDYVALPLIMLERLPQAQTIISEATQIRGSTGGPGTIESARSVYLQALLYRYAGNYEGARNALDEVLRIRIGRIPRHPETVEAMQLKGDLRFFDGDVDGAQQMWLAALDLASSTVGALHPSTTRLSQRLALAAQERGDLPSVRQWLERAMQSTLGPSAPCYFERIAILDDSGTLRDYLGDFQESRKYFDEALKSATRCLGSNHSVTATIVHNEAVLAVDMGDFAEAQRLHRQALQAWSARLGANHPYVARGLDALAGVAMIQGRPVEAERLFTRALVIRTKAFGGAHPDVASTLVNLARTAAVAGNMTRARAQIDRAIDIYRSGDRPQEPDYMAAALSLRGTLDARRGAYEEARSNFADAFAERQRVFGADHPLTAQSRADLASADFALGASDAAIDEALQAEAIGRDHLRFTIRYLPERQALAYADKRPRGLDLALSVMAAGKPSSADAVMDAVVRSRGVVLDELAARAQSARGTDGELAPLNAAVASARERFANLMLRSLKGEEPVPRPVLDEARNRKEAAERALAEQSVAARAEAASSTIGLREVREMLPPGSALVAFLRYDRTTFVPGPVKRTRMVPSYVALVLGADNQTTQMVPLGSAVSVEQAIAAWRDQVGGQAIASGVPAAEAERMYRLAGARLRQRVWDPFTDGIRGASQVFIVPDGAINLVSFAALPSGASRYLVEDGPTVHYLSTERDLVPTTAIASGRGLLAVGGPAFDQRVDAPVATSARRSGCATLGYVHFEDLPGSRNEAADITRIWSAMGAASDDAKLLSGRAATETAVKQGAIGRRVVHLATHGYFLDSRCQFGVANTRGVGALASGSVSLSALGENPLLLTGLALAGANVRSTARTGRDDGILTAEEVAGLNLQGVEWAVLSACDTGAGQIKAGEGVFGLRRAFQIAGARTIIMSLWSVEDLATRAWMRDLYDARFNKHLTTSAAVREASLNTIRGRRARHQSTHPFYWAAFVAAGDWR